MFLSILITCIKSQGDGDDDYVALSFVKEPKKLWEQGIVFYEVDPTFSLDQKQAIREAMDYIITKLEPGCIQFQRRNPEEDYYYVNIRKVEDACSSGIGRRLKGDLITDMQLMDECFSSPGTVLHELLHTLGAAHEHIRPDRNLFVDVDCEGIKNGKSGIEYQQFTRKNAYEKTSLTPYDLRSVMHYREKEIRLASADEKKPVLKVRPEYARIQDLSVQTQLELSPSDIVEISRNYGCSLKPGTEKVYVGYVNEITTALIKHIKNCLDRKEKEPIACLSGFKVATEYINEWKNWDDKSDDYETARRMLKDIEEDNYNTISSNNEAIIDIFREDKSTGRRCP